MEIHERQMDHRMAARIRGKAQKGRRRTRKGEAGGHPHAPKGALGAASIQSTKNAVTVMHLLHAGVEEINWHAGRRVNRNSPLPIHSSTHLHQHTPSRSE